MFSSDPAKRELGKEVLDKGCCMHGHYILRQPANVPNTYYASAPSPYGVSEDRVVGDRRSIHAEGCRDRGEIPSKDSSKHIKSVCGLS
jgi:hypothetical protein